MPLESGSRLGPYEILGPLGAGGMGEVFRAYDTRLGRQVAIKVLPSAFAADAERRGRFEREIQAVAALSHPNILALHDFGAHDDALYAVLELLEGETLRARLEAGGLPPSRAAEFAAQIAHGLAAAHDRGIIHRDLKPENLFVTRDERIKILDFGLARHDASSPASSGSRAPTADLATQAGAVLGTVGYMSPEQVRGQTADARSDVFALGAVFYEMLAGRRAFAGEFAADTLTAILREDPPDLLAQAPAVPRAIERIVRRCLEKRPEARFRSALDLAFAIEAVSTTGTEPRDAPAAPTELRFRRLTYRTGNISGARFTADGHSVVYGAAWEGRPYEIFASRPESPESRSLGLPSADLFAISAAGDMALSASHRHTYYYLAKGTLARASLAGGGMRRLMENVVSADWAPDGKTLAVARFVDGGCRLEYPPGQVLYETGEWLSRVRVSPDGSRVAFADHPVLGDSGGSMRIVDRAGHGQAVSPPYASINGLAWSGAGDEIWYSGIYERLECGVWSVTPAGRQRTVFSSMGRVKLHDISADGRVLMSRQALTIGAKWSAADSAHERDLSWFDGSVVEDLSADGKTLLLTEAHEAENPVYAAYVRDTDGSAAVRLGDGVGMRLSPDGKWALALVRRPTPVLMVYATGLGMPRALSAAGVERPLWAGWHPDGRRVFSVVVGTDRRRHLLLQDSESGAAEWLLDADIELDWILGLPISPDGGAVVVRLAGRGWQLFDIRDRILRPLPGIGDADVPTRFDLSGNALFISRTLDDPPRIDRLDLATGERRTHRTLRPADPAGIIYLSAAVTTGDGEGYAYSYARELSELYLVEGLV